MLEVSRSVGRWVFCPGTRDCGRLLNIRFRGLMSLSEVALLPLLRRFLETSDGADLCIGHEGGGDPDVG